MNFFGHAVLAARASQKNEFVLGSMLPDFASMLRARPPYTSHAELSAGVRFHHLCDDAFHGAPSFVALSREAARFLLERGLAKGSARAVAHVGVELELDRALAPEPGAIERYRAALACMEHVVGEIHWSARLSGARRDHGAAGLDRRLLELCRTLYVRSISQDDTPPELTAERLGRILEGRPRLRLDEAGQSVVREWVVAARPSIVSRAPTLVRELEQRLLA